MSVAALREEIQRELTVWALGSMHRMEPWERRELASPLIAAHMPPGTFIRLPWTLMPDWFRQIFHDPTQIDGRVVVEEVDSVVVRVRTPVGTKYSVEADAFLDAVLAGQVGDAA